MGFYPNLASVFTTSAGSFATLIPSIRT